MKKLIIALSSFLALSAFAQIDMKNLPVEKKSTTIKTLPSGITIEIKEQGLGQKPTANSSVEVHYRGYFKNNQEFDSSYKRGQSISFPLANVISCWTQGMQELAEGSKATLFCPSNTAYGSRGASGAVPPNTDLYFDVELIKVK